MFNVVLYEPEIPPNTGNIIRLCANSGARLHLVHPLGFSLEDRQLRRAGLDYHEYARITEHADLSACRTALAGLRWFALSTRGRRGFTDVRFQPGDVLLFGPETRGLPQSLLDEMGPEHVLRVPMQPHNRSLNLSNSVAIVVYEAWRQLGFAGGE
jgi:tRNA (cytidine/uridine-2'-O-)-methyltransferase